MKRPGNDENNDAKRIKVLQGFQRLEEKVQESFRKQRHDEVIQMCQHILSIDSEHSMAHYYSARSHEDLHMKIHHFQQYFAQKDDTDEARICFAHDQLTRAFHRVKSYDDSVASFLQTLKYNPSRIQKHCTYSSLARIHDKSLKDEVQAKKWYMRLVEYALEEIYISEHTPFFTTFCEAYKKCFLEESRKMEDLLGNTDAFKFFLKDAYENWNSLTPVHQKHIEITRPEEHTQLKEFSSFAKSFMPDIIGLEFTSFTISFSKFKNNQKEPIAPCKIISFFSN